MSSEEPASGPKVATGTANPVGALLVGAAAPSLAGLAVVTAVAALRGLDEVGSALVGGGLALLAMAVGPVLHQLCRRLDPAMVLGIVVLAYGTVVIALGLAFSSLNDIDRLSGEFAGAGVFVIAAGWTVGQIRASLKLRQPLYTADHAADQGTVRR